MLIVAAVWIVAGVAKPGFGSFGHLRHFIELAAVVGLVAIGQTFVAIAGGIELSVNAIVTVSAVGVPLVVLRGDSTGAGRHCYDPRGGDRHRLPERPRCRACPYPPLDHDARHGDLLLGRTSILGGSGTYADTIPGAALLITTRP